METRFWLVCYDIRNERRLHRVAKVMQQFGVRAQKSVFECWLSDSGLTQMHKALGKIIDRDRDSVRCYSLCKVCRDYSGEKTGTSIAEVERYYIA